MKVLVEHKSGYKLGHEETLIKEHALSRGFSVEIAAFSNVNRSRFQVKSFDLVVGELPFVKASLRQHGKEMPKDDCYPLCLQKFMGRSYRETSLGDALRMTQNGPLFIKPSEKSKRFTGLVVGDPYEYRVASVSRSERVWVVERVQFIAEFRCYVSRGSLVSVSWYAGERSLLPDRVLIETAVAEMSVCPDSPCSYALDFGVTKSGATLLVEANDAFSLGCYEGMSSQDYFELLLSRWQQLTGEGPAQ
jgi:hypothetical protein